MDRSRSRIRVRAALLVALLLLASSAPALADSTSRIETTVTSADSSVPDTVETVDGATTQGTHTGSSANSSALASGDSTIHRTLVLALTPTKPGEIAVTARFEFPENVRAFETSIPASATVVSTTGFSRSEAETYSWDGATTNARIRFTLPANQSTDGVRAAHLPGGTADADESGVRERTSGVTQSGQYSFVDAGPWALVSVPQFSSNWRYVGERPTLEKTVTIDGEGATGGEIAYLGPHRSVERTAHGQRFELVVPAAASLRSPPDDILDSLTDASDALRVDARDEHVFVVAAPTSVDWQAAGIEYGGSDFWVKDDEPIDDARNVWLHEYVHTRQNYRPTAGTRWTTEASADYYAALLTLQQGRISFSNFRNHLDRGTRESVATTVLADPDSWTKSTPYLKGALVYGNTDRQIRVDSDRTRSMQSVLSRMNTDPDEVTTSEFYSFVGAAGTTDTRTYVERYASTRDAPSPWSATEHGDAFTELPSRIGYRTSDVRVTGEYRDELLGKSPTLTTGETVRATIEVTNTGGAEGPFETTLYVDGSPAATRNGTIEAETTRTVSLTHTFETAGTHTLTVGGESWSIVVADPEQPSVTELVVNASQDGGAWTSTITVSVNNPGDRPATGTIPVTIDGETITTLDVELGPGESSTYTVTAPITPGSHTISAGNVSTSLDVPTTTSNPTAPVTSPGFGVALSLFALLMTALAHARHK